MSKRSLYTHFESKDNLFLAVLDQLSETGHWHPQRSDAAPRRLRVRTLVSPFGQRQMSASSDDARERNGIPDCVNYLRP
jgi:AcrR family transcriptional regulator